MRPHLTHIFTLRGYVSHDSAHTGTYLSGPQRIITPLEGGFVRGVLGTRGEALDVILMKGGSDWALFESATNTLHIDVRTQGTMAGRDAFYIQYTGYWAVDEQTTKFIARSSDALSTQFGDHHWWIRPTIETNCKLFKISQYDNFRWLIFNESYRFQMDGNCSLDRPWALRGGGRAPGSGISNISSQQLEYKLKKVVQKYRLVHKFCFMSSLHSFVLATSQKNGIILVYCKIHNIDCPCCGYTLNWLNNGRIDQDGYWVCRSHLN